ncbi:tetratricopeptide repeat protein [Aestuariibacter sp. AA17]|uniref:Tetratricopeptide repeat protein n=1 Tax=Fluctibacter corallii TaxID=2984329 RepID=A0ABT3ABI3_9ALTE|nr:tetratricopeptide repeat protein [Aestuariibacter sp. AA17]MCV2886031.1 tetratricopeptide repeat protein [Aestuariibacter sp. AA17]
MRKFHLPKIHSLSHWIGAAVIALIAAPTHALDFTPTEAEWLVWNPLCKARYVVSGAGSSSPFRDRVSMESVKMWRDKVGNEAWYALHHYCAGIHEESRGKLQQAKYEYFFTYARMPREHYLYGLIGVRLANVFYKMGNVEEAHKMASSTISTHPRYSGGYVIKGILFSRQGEYQKVIDILEEGMKNVSPKSSEMSYHLGLAYLELNKLDKAKEYAIQAYEMGYNLPGLKQRLIEAGAW